MDAFLRLASGGSSVEQFAKEVHIKAQLTSKINGAIRRLQHEYLLDDGFLGRAPGVPIVLAETSSPAVVDLCMYLEASLLHGLKEKLSLSRVRTAVLGPTSPANFSVEATQCQLDFWPIVLILCHNQVSDSLMKLSNISTDIGRCRAWLRQTLNEGLFGSYLEALTHDTSLLHGFYRSSAYIRDRDHMSIVRSVLEALDSLSFQLNYDCSSLNCWSVETLKTIGIAVQLVPEPVMPGTDALDEIRKIEIKQSRQRRREREREKSMQMSSTNTITTNSDTGSGPSSLQSSQLSCSSPSNFLLGMPTTTSVREQFMSTRKVVQHMTLKLAMPSSQAPPDIVITPTESPPMSAASQNGSEFDDDEIGTPLKSEVSDRSSVVSGNSINRKQGWSSSPPQRIRETSRNQVEASYESVLQSYSTEVVLSSTPDIRDINGSSTFAKLSALKERSFSMFDTRRRRTHGIKTKPEITYGNIDDFEVVPKSIVLNNAEPETHEFLMQLSRLGNEVGLDQQDYKCNSCGRPIGMIYGKSRLCHFDGYNYCTDCHDGKEEVIIPSKVLHNWDFKKYPVAKRNKNYLSLTEAEPLLDIKITSPILYKSISELQASLELRTQLFYLHAYIFTCAESVTLELRKLLWPKEHLFEHIHLYSCQDLMQLVNGQLALSIKKAIAFARKHVISCPLCSQKGFYCEICRDQTIIYPFDTATNYRCDKCKAVFHNSCVLDEKGHRKIPCPRCIRFERREQAERAFDK